MADENDKGKAKAPAAAGGPPKLDRRDLLMGLSTVPALGLFGYAWSRQQAAPRAAGGGGRRDAGGRRRACRRSTSRCSAPAPRARC